MNLRRDHPVFGDGAPCRTCGKHECPGAPKSKGICPVARERVLAIPAGTPAPLGFPIARIEGSAELTLEARPLRRLKGWRLIITALAVSSDADRTRDLVVVELSVGGMVHVHDVPAIIFLPTLPREGAPPVAIDIEANELVSLRLRNRGVDDVEVYAVLLGVVL